MHFPKGVSADQDVTVLGKTIGTDLDKLQTEIKEQNATLEACLSQLDQYQQVRKCQNKVCLLASVFSV